MENEMSSEAEKWLNEVESLPAPKYSADDVMAAIMKAVGSEDEYDDMVSEFWYGVYKELDFNGIKEQVVWVADFGGEGMGDMCYVVIQIGDQYFRKDGYYQSYEGSTWDGEFYECFPKEVTRTEYHRKAIKKPRRR